MKTKQSQDDNKAQASFRENANKLERFIKENMPGAAYTCFIYDKEAGITYAMKGNEDNEDGLESVAAAIAIFPESDKEEIMASCFLFGKLMMTLLSCATGSPILLELFKNLIVKAAPQLDGLDVMRYTVQENKDNLGNKPQNAH